MQYPQTHTIVNGSGALPPHAIAAQADYWEVGFDPGSGWSIMYATPIKIVHEAGKPFVYRGNTIIRMIPSIVGDVSLEDILNSRPVQEDEYIIRSSDNKSDRVVGRWAEIEGQNATTAKGLAERYWGAHAREILQAMLAAIIPTQKARVRLVTGLPFSLYVAENRKKVAESLGKVHSFTFKGQPREFTVVVGRVISEGYAPLAYLEEINDDQISVDIGDRTANFIWTYGLSILPQKCRCEEYGVSRVHEALLKKIKRKYKQGMKTAEIREYLTTYTSGNMLKPLSTPTGIIEDTELRGIIEDEVDTQWKPIKTTLGQMLNQEEAEVGTGIKRMAISGGGAYVFAPKFRAYLPNTEIVMPENAQQENARYYHDLVRSLEANQPGFWNR